MLELPCSLRSESSHTHQIWILGPNYACRSCRCRIWKNHTPERHCSWPYDRYTALLQHLHRNVRVSQHGGPNLSYFSAEGCTGHSTLSIMESLFGTGGTGLCTQTLLMYCPRSWMHASYANIALLITSTVHSPLPFRRFRCYLATYATEPPLSLMTCPERIHMSA